MSTTSIAEDIVNPDITMYWEEYLTDIGITHKQKDTNEAAALRKSNEAALHALEDAESFAQAWLVYKRAPYNSPAGQAAIGRMIEFAITLEELWKVYLLSWPGSEVENEAAKKINGYVAQDLRRKPYTLFGLKMIERCLPANSPFHQTVASEIAEFA